MEELALFERLVRSLEGPSQPPRAVESGEPPNPHEFDVRNIHPDLPGSVRRLFDDGHYEHATFEAFKFIEKEVKRIAKLRGKTGLALMMEAFNEKNAKILLNALATDSDEDEQLGYKHMFAGAMAGVRNPRGHEIALGDGPSETLDYLALASLLPRRLDTAGVR